MMLRPLSGSSCTRMRSTTSPMVVERVSTPVASALTVTLSVNCPTDSTASTRALAFTSSVMPSCMKRRKPAFSACNEYCPTGRFEITYAPESSLVASRVNEVETFRAVTLTCGITAPELSRTTPNIVAVVFWAQQHTANANHPPTKETYNAMCFMESPRLRVALTSHRLSEQHLECKRDDARIAGAFDPAETREVIQGLVPALLPNVGYWPILAPLKSWSAG